MKPPFINQFIVLSSCSRNFCSTSHCASASKEGSNSKQRTTIQLIIATGNKNKKPLAKTFATATTTTWNERQLLGKEQNNHTNLAYQNATHNPSREWVNVPVCVAVWVCSSGSFALPSPKQCKQKQNIVHDVVSCQQQLATNGKNLHTHKYTKTRTQTETRTQHSTNEAHTCTRVRSKCAWGWLRQSASESNALNAFHSCHWLLLCIGAKRQRQLDFVDFKFFFV